VARVAKQEHREKAANGETPMKYVLDRRPAARSVSLALLLPVLACGKPEPSAVSPADVPGLVREYERGQSAIIRDSQGQRLLLRPSAHPTLSICHATPDVFNRAGLAQSLRCELVRAPLGEVRVVEGSLHIAERQIPFQEVGLSSLDFDGDDPRELARPGPGQRGNRWGVNVTAGGAAGLIGVALDARAAPWMGLELGVVPIVGAAGAFAGIRLHPWRPAGVYPYVGAQASYWVVGEAEDPKDAQAITSYGLRTGLAIDLKRDMEIRAEFDLSHNWLYGDGWVPCGGGAVATYW